MGKKMNQATLALRISIHQKTSLREKKKRSIKVRKMFRIDISDKEHMFSKYTTEFL